MRLVNLRRNKKVYQERKHKKKKGSIGEGNGNPLQYSCLRNPMDRGAWRIRDDLATKQQQHWKKKKKGSIILGTFLALK